MRNDTSLSFTMTSFIAYFYYILYCVSPPLALLPYSWLYCTGNPLCTIIRISALVYTIRHGDLFSHCRYDRTSSLPSGGVLLVKTCNAKCNARFNANYRARTRKHPGGVYRSMHNVYVTRDLFRSHSPRLVASNDITVHIYIYIYVRIYGVCILDIRKFAAKEKADSA